MIPPVSLSYILHFQVLHIIETHFNVISISQETSVSVKNIFFQAASLQTEERKKNLRIYLQHN